MRKVSESAKALNWPARALAGTTEDGRVAAWLRNVPQNLTIRTAWLQSVKGSP